MSEHEVVYAQGDQRVVCSCGGYFTTPDVSALTFPPSGLAQWANHQASARVPVTTRPVSCCVKVGTDDCACG